jgi:hypothetical protein
MLQLKFQLIKQLIQTIRYWKIPLFQILEEAIKFYWGVTSKFSNWKIFYSENSSKTSSVKMNNDNIKTVTTTSVIGNEETKQTFDSKDNFKARRSKS